MPVLKCRILASRARGLLEVIFFFGSYTFAFNVGVALHELGHASAMWLCGGVVARIKVHPFGLSYVVGLPPNYPFMLWAGAGLGSLFALLLVGLSWRFRSPYWTPVLATGFVTLLSNGFYLIAGPLLLIRSDPRGLVEIGSPPALPVVVGVALFGGGVVLGGLTMSRMGVGWGDPPWKRLATPVGGLLLFLGCVIAGHVACRTEEILPFAGGTVGAVLVVGVPLALLLQSRLRWMRTLEPAALTWRHAAFAVALGIAIVLIALIS